jgi:hypothetical protein
MKILQIIVVVIMAFVALVMLDIDMSPRAKIRSGPSCSFNLKVIQLAKMMYAADNYLTNDIVFTKEQLLPYLNLNAKWLQCPRGGEYSIGTLHESPTCSYPAHATLRVPAN